MTPPAPPSPQPQPRLAANVRGALWILASAVAFVCMTSLIKFLGEGYPAPLQTLYRQGAGLLLVLPLILRNPGLALRTTRPKLLLFRAACSSTAMILQFYSYQAMPLAEANALSFTRPLWIAPLAVFILGETLGAHRILATLLGFAGVLVMLAPTEGAQLGWPQAAALLSAFLFAFSIMGMKTMTKDHSPLTVLSWAVILGFLFSIVPALTVWRWPTLPDLGLLALMGCIGVVNHACYIKGMSIGDAAAIAPVDYTRLLFAVAIGYFVFQESPTARTLVGAAIVAAATIYITWREQRAARRARSGAP